MQLFNITVEFTLVPVQNGFKRKVNETIATPKNKPALNRDRGHEIPPILFQCVSRDHSGHVT